jgi:hypothetical protein
MSFRNSLFRKSPAEDHAEFARGVINALLLSLLFFIVILLWLLL